jgi:uncharacterized protein YbaP (TraB family)
MKPLFRTFPALLLISLFPTILFAGPEEEPPLTENAGASVSEGPYPINRSISEKQFEYYQGVKQTVQRKLDSLSPTVCRVYEHDDTFGQMPFCQIKLEGKSFYLLGTNHYIPFALIPQHVWETLDKASALYVEHDLLATVDQFQRRSEVRPLSDLFKATEPFFKPKALFLQTFTKGQIREFQDLDETSLFFLANDWEVLMGMDTGLLVHALHQKKPAFQMRDPSCDRKASLLQSHKTAIQSVLEHAEQALSQSGLSDQKMQQIFEEFSEMFEGLIKEEYLGEELAQDVVMFKTEPLRWKKLSLTEPQISERLETLWDEFSRETGLLLENLPPQAAAATEKGYGDQPALDPSELFFKIWGVCFANAQLSVLKEDPDFFLEYKAYAIVTFDGQETLNDFQHTVEYVKECRERTKNLLMGGEMPFSEDDLMLYKETIEPSNAAFVEQLKNAPDNTFAAVGYAHLPGMLHLFRQAGATVLDLTQGSSCS